MSSKTHTCPSCGAQNVGKYCGECGAKIQRACPSCGTVASAKARFCPECGASLDGSARKKDQLPWIVVGAAGLLLAAAGAFLIYDRQSASTPTPSPSTRTATTPAPSAEELFNRVMAASERGDVAEARRFAPDALEAYRRLPALDEDAHYHVGLIHLTMGDIEAAEEDLDAIRRSEPDHLLGIMLEHAIAEAEGDEERALEAYTRFLSVYDTQILADRDEYRGHRNGIEGFRARALAAR